VIEFARGWSEVCDSAIVPVVDDKKAMEIFKGLEESDPGYAPAYFFQATIFE